MRVVINGESVDEVAAADIASLLAERRVSMPDMVTVELNGAIIKREHYGETAIKDGDQIEFLYYMGGGRYLVDGEFKVSLNQMKGLGNDS